VAWEIKTGLILGNIFIGRNCIYRKLFSMKSSAEDRKMDKNEKLAQEYDENWGEEKTY